MAEGAAEHDARARCERAAHAAAYLDGELSAAVAEGFEGHLRECSFCSAAVAEQRRLLCLLDTAFDETFDRSIELPGDFARELQVRAQTDMGGVRAREERKMAVGICAALTAASFALLGAATFNTVLEPAAAAARTAVAVAGLAGHAAAEAGAGAGMVLRAVSGRVAATSELLLVLKVALLLGGLALLLRLIGSYHRSRESE